MDYTGKWKLSKMIIGIDEGFVAKPIDEIIAECTDEDEKKDLLHQKETIIDINPDGRLYMLMPLPDDVKNKSKEELLKLFKDEGIENPILTDTHFSFRNESQEWEMRGDDLFVNMGDMGCTYDDDGNEVPCDPWVKWSDSKNRNVIHFFTAEYEKM